MVAAPAAMSKKRDKKKKKRFGAVERARLGARQAIGTPRPTRTVPSKKHKPPKHKKELLSEELEEL